LSPDARRPTTCEAEAQTPSEWSSKRKRPSEESLAHDKRPRSSTSSDKENDERLMEVMHKEAQSDSRKRKHAYGGHTPAKKKFSHSEADEEESSGEEPAQEERGPSGVSTFRLQMTPDDDRYNSPRSARSAQLSMGGAATPQGGRDALAHERLKMRVREEELNEVVNMSYHNFIQLSRSQKKKERDPSNSDHFDSSRSSSVNRTLDWSELNSSHLSGYDADFEQVESGAEQQRRRGTRLPRASIAPGATRIPEPSNRAFKPASRIVPEMKSSGSMRQRDTRRMSLIPTALNPHAPSGKAAKSTSKRAPLRTPRGDLI